MEGVAEKVFTDILDSETKTKGIATLRKFSVNPEEAIKTNQRQIMKLEPNMYRVESGDFISLHIDGWLYMSDTRMEKNTNQEFINKAKNTVMVAGLGIGLVLHNLREKVESGVVKSITIYEKYQDVIDLVAPYYSDLPITYICADILEYKPPMSEKYDTIYFDIWENISPDNLQEISMLHRRWCRRKLQKDSWMGSWLQKFIQVYYK